MTDRWVALCYHDVRPAAAAVGGGPDRFSASLRAFETMLDMIEAAGYRGCSLSEARHSAGTARVAITFDDATDGQFRHAVPALVQRRMTATIYVATDWVGRPGFMTWSELRAAAEQGMSIQSHTRTHPFLSELGAEALREELRESKRRIDAELGQRTTELAFPGGDAPRERLSHLLAEAGYEAVVGTRWGLNRDGDPPGQPLRRCTVRGELDARTATRYVKGDRWMAAVEGPREAGLRTLRRFLGPSRYARLRRGFLDALTGRREVRND